MHPRIGGQSWASNTLNKVHNLSQPFIFTSYAILNHRTFLNFRFFLAEFGVLAFKVAILYNRNDVMFILSLLLVVLFQAACEYRALCYLCSLIVLFLRQDASWYQVLLTSYIWTLHRLAKGLWVDIISS